MKTNREVAKARYPSNRPSHAMVVALLGGLMVGSGTVGAQTPEERGRSVAEAAEASDFGWQDNLSTMRMVLRNRGGQESTRTLRRMALEMSGEGVGDRSIIVFESPIGQVAFPHEAHFDMLEIECETCHHEHNAARLDFPHPEYFEDFWIECGICHHDVETPKMAQSCSTCHHRHTDSADETLSSKVVIHQNCWQCHERGKGKGASETCVFCHSGPKTER